MTRRQAIKTATLATACAALAPRHAAARGSAAGGPHPPFRLPLVLQDIPLDTLCQAKQMGLQSVEILKLDDLPTLKKHGLICAMVTGVPGDIPKGLNRLENHDRIAAFFQKTLPSWPKRAAPT